MTTLTRERLEQLANFRGAPVTRMEEQELARIALAAIQQEPVALTIQCWSCRDEIEVSAVGDCDGYCPKCNSPIDLDEEPYTIPLPAPVVPDERQSLNNGIVGFDEGWNACRAAMLNGGEL